MARQEHHDVTVAHLSVIHYTGNHAAVAIALQMAHPRQGSTQEVAVVIGCGLQQHRLDAGVGLDRIGKPCAPQPLPLDLGLEWCAR